PTNVFRRDEVQRSPHGPRADDRLPGNCSFNVFFDGSFQALANRPQRAQVILRLYRTHPLYRLAGACKVRRDKALRAEAIADELGCGHGFRAICSRYFLFFKTFYILFSLFPRNFYFYTVILKDIFKTIIADFHNRPVQRVKSRELELPVRSGKIITLTGPRRSGKSYCFLYLINDLVENRGGKIEEILYLNFEDERLQLKASDLNIILQAYEELYPGMPLENCYFFFGEIQ